MRGQDGDLEANRAGLLTTEILSAIGSLAMRWNASEATVRRVLRILSDNGWAGLPRHQKPTVKQMMAKLKEASRDDSAPNEIRGALAHLCSFLEITQGYRNFYLHELVGPFGVDLEGNKAVILAYGEQPAAVGLERRFAEVTAADVRLAEGYCRTLGKLASDLAHNILLITPSPPSLYPLPLLPPVIVLPYSSPQQ